MTEQTTTGHTTTGHTTTGHLTDADQSCGCSDFSTSRRAFLRGAVALSGAGVATTMFGSAAVRASYAPSGKASGVLVVLSLRGGADGMSLVVPHGDVDYEIVRPTIHIPPGGLIGADDMYGLHPEFAPLRSMWEANKIAAVHAVGLEQPNRSHFAAMEAIEDADPGSPEREGWLNRLVGLNATVEPIEAVQFGSSILPTSLFGPEPVIAINQLEDMFLPSRDDKEMYRNRVASLRHAWRSTPGSFGQGATAAIDLSRQFEKLVDDLGDPLHGAVYPNGDLGDALADAAQLIRAGMGAEVITVDAGSWDMHVSLGTATHGRMVEAVSNLAQAIEAFFVDLGELGSDVTLVTITEFGRRVAENKSNGLDHGWASAMLVVGAGVKGGYYGKWPGLRDLTDGDLPITNDFRSVLGEIVKVKFNADVTKVFPGFHDDPVQLGFMHT